MNSADILQSLLKDNSFGQIDHEALLQIEKKKWHDYEVSSQFKQEIYDVIPEIQKHFLSPPSLHFSSSEVIIGERHQIDTQGIGPLYRSLKNLMPWRKGPFSFFGIDLDAEWKSDLKWDRIQKALGNCENKIILDVGANNGYFMFRLLEKNPKLVLGIDPVMPCLDQFYFIKNLGNIPKVHMAPWGIEDLQYFKNCFDTILFMGIIYHHKHPLKQLEILKEALRPGGTLIIETLGISGNESYSFFPEERYANMKNVYFVPTLSCLTNWVKRTRFEHIETLFSTPLTGEEQRITEWSYPVSLEKVLDPNNSKSTIQGDPAPWRFALSCQKKLI